jgi:hypothetical protein
MPISSGSRNLMNLRVTRLLYMTDPISLQERIGDTPQFPSLLTKTEMLTEHEIARNPVPPLKYGPSSSSLTRQFSPVVLETPEGESAQATESDIPARTVRGRFGVTGDRSRESEVS